MSRVIISSRDFGKAIARYICLKNGVPSFNPCKIDASSIVLVEDLTVDISEKPLSEPLDLLEECRDNNLDGMEFILTREEVLEAITMKYELFHSSKDFAGNRVESLSIELPDRMAFLIVYTMMGTSMEDSAPNFDGSLT